MSDFENRLKAIEADLRVLVTDDHNRNFFITTPEVDLQCQEIGCEILKENPQLLAEKKVNKNLVVYITGALYTKGGHTREIEDWIKTTYSDKKNIILLSSPTRNSNLQQLENLKAQNIEVLYTQETGLVERIKWLQQKLFELAPQAVIVSTTPTDLVSLATLQPELLNKLYWNLSIDSGVSIGVHLAPITKIIVKRPYFYFLLRDQLQLKNLAYIPFNRPDVIGKREQYVSTAADKKIITASCTSACYKIESEYKYRFVEVVPNILKITGGKHFHYGDISQNGLARIYENMDRLGVSRQNFVRVNYVPSLAKALIEDNVDILLQTFPFGGGLVTIEALQAGKMIINQKNYATYLNNLSDFCYKNAFSWKAPQDLYDYLRNLSREEIIRQSRLSRHTYEQEHDSNHLRAVGAIENMTGIEIESRKNEIAAMYEYTLNYYQKFLDEGRARKIGKVKKKNLLERLRRSFKKRYEKLMNKVKAS